MRGGRCDDRTRPEKERFMIVKRVYSPDVYRKIMHAEPEKKDDIYRYELMLPFQGKWDCYHIPLKASREGGYDVIMANNRMGLYPPSKINHTTNDWIEAISDPKLWDACQESIENALERFAGRGIEPKVREYLFSIFLADPENAYTRMNEGYCGDGGIPGFVMGWLIPNETNLKKLPAALAHETNHNIRYQFIRWTNDVTLGEMLVGEGLAENFATSIYGEAFLGPWVSRTDPELLPLIREIIRDGLHATGFEQITAYLYGDEMAEMQCFPKAGLPYCAGYAVGYDLIRYYLQKTGISIEEATILPHEEILGEVEEYWGQI